MRGMHQIAWWGCDNNRSAGLVEGQSTRVGYALDDSKSIYDKSGSGNDAYLGIDDVFVSTEVLNLDGVVSSL